AALMPGRHIDIDDPRGRVAERIAFEHAAFQRHAMHRALRRVEIPSHSNPPKNWRKRERVRSLLYRAAVAAPAARMRVSTGSFLASPDATRAIASATSSSRSGRNQKPFSLVAY